MTAIAELLSVDPELCTCACCLWGGHWPLHASAAGKVVHWHEAMLASPQQSPTQPHTLPCTAPISHTWCLAPCLTQYVDPWVALSPAIHQVPPLLGTSGLQSVMWWHLPCGDGVLGMMMRAPGQSSMFPASQSSPR